MKIAAIVPFFNYGYGNKDLLFKFFCLHAAKWIKYVDEINVVDSGCGLTLPDIPNLKITVAPPQSHWQNMNEAIRNTDADMVLLLDSDTIIYDPEVIQESIEMMEREQLDAYGIFDGSGAQALTAYPIMRENEDRAERRRFAPYFFFLRKSALRSDFDFTPESGPIWTDSMGSVTRQLLVDKKVIMELPDDRSTISLEDDGTITHTQWLDDPSKHNWSKVENPNYGYYHIRNFGGALKIVKEGEFGLVPGREARRLLMWFVMLSEATKSGYNVEEILSSVDVYTDMWNKYYEEFKKYHWWLEKI